MHWPMRFATSTAQTKRPTLPGRRTSAPTWARWSGSRLVATKLSLLPASLFRGKPPLRAAAPFCTTAPTAPAGEAASATVVLTMLLKAARGGPRSGPADTSRVRPAKEPAARTRNHESRQAKPGPTLTGLLETHGMGDSGMIGRGMGPIILGAIRNARRGSLGRLPHGQRQGDARPAHRPHKLAPGDGLARTLGSPRAQGGDHPRRRVGLHRHGVVRQPRGLGRESKPPQPTDAGPVCHHSPTLVESKLVRARLLVSLCSSYRGPPWAGRKPGNAGD